MAEKKYNDEDGVWRTIGGRRVFIKKGQSLSDAMKESGKFSRVAKNQELYKKLDEEQKKQETYPKAQGGTKFEDLDLNVEEKEAFSNYLRNKYGTDDFRIINFDNKENAKKIYDEFKETQKKTKELMDDLSVDKGYWEEIDENTSRHYSRSELRKKYGTDDIELINAGKSKEDRVSLKEEKKYTATKREGFGSYNDDWTPVYNGDIDYTGNFGKTDLSKLSDEEITKALNEQSKLWREAENEKVGDRRTRNGRMDQIFKNAKVNQYEQGSKRLSEEIDKRGLPRYNIYDVKNKDMILVSSPTKEMAERQLQEMYETDKNLQKSYGWKELPKYEIKESKASAKETEEQMSGNKINNSLRNKGYQKYMKEHPGSKMTLEDYLKKQK